MKMKPLFSGLLAALLALTVLAGCGEQPPKPDAAHTPQNMRAKKMGE